MQLLVDETEITDAGRNLVDVADEENRLDTGNEDGNQSKSNSLGEAVVQGPDDPPITGRRGEAAMHQYFVEQLGSSNVNWLMKIVNLGCLMISSSQRVAPLSMWR